MTAAKERPYPIPADERQRLAAIYQLGLCVTDLDAELGEYCERAAAACGTPMSLVTFIDFDRQFFAAKVGIEGRSTLREHSICAHAIVDRKLFVVNDAQLDPRFSHNPFVTGEPFVRFYAGIPIVLGEVTLGTVCVVDRVPRDLTSQQADTLTKIGKQVSDYLTATQLNGLAPPLRRPLFGSESTHAA